MKLQEVLAKAMLKARAPYDNAEEYQSDLLLLLKLRLNNYCQAVIDPENRQPAKRLGSTMQKEHIFTYLDNQDAPDTIAFAERNRSLNDLLQIRDMRIRLSREQGISLPLEDIKGAFSLTPFQCFLLELALATELDRHFERVFVYLQDDYAAKSPTLGFAVQVFTLNAAERLNLLHQYSGPEQALRYLFQSAEPVGNNFVLKLHPRILSYILNQPLDAETSVWALFPPTDSLPPLLCHEDEARQIARFGAYHQDAGRQAFAILNIQGAPGSGKLLQARYFAQSLGRRLLVVDLHAALLQKTDWQALTDQIGREAHLQKALVCLRHIEALTAQNTEDNTEGQAAFSAILQRMRAFCPLLLLSSTRDAVPTLPDPFRLQTIRLSPLTNLQRLAFWQNTRQQITEKCFTGSPPPVWEENIAWSSLANKFELSPGQIAKAMTQAVQTAALHQEEVDLACIHQACHDQLSRPLGNKVSRVSVVFNWEDLILPPASKKILRLACDQVLNSHIVYEQWNFQAKLPYGRGLSLLFTGPPGTGKTMGAQVMAKELMLEIYKVDLAGLMSKYIGETEENLRDVFEQVEKSQSILFFDEADAVFGKRTETKDAQDRFANIQSSYLLQKMEEYGGIVILATNFLQNFDDAFKRRFKYIVEFPQPDSEQRAKIWRAVFPAEVPLGDIDWDFLAETFTLTGANIKNIALCAAFIAAQTQESIGMTHIIRALRLELSKIGHVVLQDELGIYAYLN